MIPKKINEASDEEITNEPEDVKETSPKLFAEFLEKHEEAMEDATDDE